MLLPGINIPTLTTLLTPHMGKPVWPGLIDPETIARTRDFARQSGLWDLLGAELNTAGDILILKRSGFRDYQRTGSRVRGEAAIKVLADKTHLAALALWLDHPNADLVYFQDLIWAWCETTWWKLAAHESLHIDLVSSLRARELAEYSHIFAGMLDSEVRERISHEVAVRVLDIAHDVRRADWWQTGDNNWNLVCNANLIQTALYEIHDPAELAAYIHPVCRRMDYALDYFTDDGGCVEGVGYWAYGFCNFIDAAIALHERTGGKIDFSHDEKIERICRFPLAAFLSAPVRASFADGGNGYLNAGDVLRINYLKEVPDLFQLVVTGPGGLPEISDMRGLALYRGEVPRPHTDRKDAILPQLGYVKACVGDVVLAAQAGSNGVSHNHNDIGSFLLVKNGVDLLTDPGSPVYSAKTFGPHRYDMLVCRSKGHSVPLINGFEQQTGSEFAGTIAAENLNGSGSKTITIDLTGAYPDPTLRKLIRTLRLEPDGTVLLADFFEFESMPQEVVEMLVTFEHVIVRDGLVEIGNATSQTTICANISGTYEVETFSPEQHEGRDPRPLNRIRFIPAELSASMRLELSFS